MLASPTSNTTARWVGLSLLMSSIRELVNPKIAEVSSPALVTPWIPDQCIISSENHCIGIDKKEPFILCCVHIVHKQQR
ncbi:hypothetical protein QE442_003751 [Chryseobacterium sp. SORGH_AS1175]|nr:hypothetical protein [Chryseobacterium sp. SORGH_AS_1175]